MQQQDEVFTLQVCGSLHSRSMLGLAAELVTGSKFFKPLAVQLQLWMRSRLNTFQLCNCF